MEGYRIIYNKLSILNILLLFTGCLGYSYPVHAQKIFIDSVPNIKTKMLTYNIGFTGNFNRSPNGESAWKTGDNKDAIGFINTLQYMLFSSKSTLGYGVQLYSYARNKNHYIENYNSKEKISIIYIAPQLAYLKRETAFKHCFSIIGGGIGYLNYSSKRKIITEKDCKAHSSSIGLHTNIGYEYLFVKGWGIRLQIDCLFSPINLHYSSIPKELSFNPRNKFGLCLMNIQIGISSHL